MLALLFLLQAAAGGQPPDVALTFHARAKSVEIRQKGGKLEVRGSEGSRVESRVQPRAQGRTKLRNVTIDVHAEARVAATTGIRATAETGTHE